jgi:hypothetical protein
MSARLVGGRAYVIIRTRPVWVNADGSWPAAAGRRGYLRNVSPLYREISDPKDAAVAADRKQV